MTPMRCLAALALAVAVPAAAQWPAKPVKIVVAFTPGGVHDTVTRLLSVPLGEALGQPIVIENRGGAGGNIAAESVAKSAPDGYTFLVASEAMASNPALYAKLAYDPVKDLTPVAKLADYPVALVAYPGLPASDVAELVALAKAKPGSLTYGSAGVGTAGHLAAEQFSHLAGIDMVHVPYKGGAPALTDLMAGRIHAMFLSMQLSAPQVRAGRLKALAIAGRNRAAQLPNVPTTAEQGYPQFEAQLFSGLFAPAGTPPEIVQRMNAEVVKALRAPEMQARLAEVGAVPAPSTPEEFARILRSEGERMAIVIREKHIRAE
jgi:tripartite-type tricarboxylate transporter receptor subunit TctC